MEPSDLIFALSTIDGEPCIVIVPRDHFRENEDLYEGDLENEVPEIGEIVADEGDSVFSPHSGDFDEARRLLLGLGLKESKALRDFFTSNYGDDEEDEDEDEDEEDFEDEDFDSFEDEDDEYEDDD